MAPQQDVVALAATINADDDRLAAIARAAAEVDNGAALCTRAETEGVAPMLHRYLSTLGIGEQVAGYRALRALAVRHRHATEIRVAEFARISAQLATAGIASAALKGVGLAGLLYPEPGLRPMRDIDFLVPRSEAGAARAVLESMGYRFDPDHPSRYMRWHHHLPNARREVDGLTVSVEIHTRANSGDSPGRTTFDRLRDPLQTVQSAFGEYRTLGHGDMLNQLCRHALEPGAHVRLVSVMDIQGYCARFDQEIDWAALARRHPYIPNFLSLLDQVVPLPSTLTRFAWPGQPLPDPGRLVPTVGTVFSTASSRRQAVGRLLSPPPWWFHSYYGVPADGRGNTRARLAHVARVGTWLGRRATSALGFAP